MATTVPTEQTYADLRQEAERLDRVKDEAYDAAVGRVGFDRAGTDQQFLNAVDAAFAAWQRADLEDRRYRVEQALTTLQDEAMVSIENYAATGTTTYANEHIETVMAHLRVLRDSLNNDLPRS